MKIISICIPDSQYKEIETNRGLVSRSKYLSNLLSASLLSNQHDKIK